MPPQRQLLVLILKKIKAPDIKIEIKIYFNVADRSHKERGCETISDTQSNIGTQRSGLHASNRGSMVDVSAQPPIPEESSLKADAPEDGCEQKDILNRSFSCFLHDCVV